MLPKRYRLRRAADFRRVHGRGRCWSTDLLVLCTLSNELSHSRFGFSVSKRVGNAVTRNRIKRLLREATRFYCDLVSPGMDVVFIAKPGARSADYWTIERRVTQLFSMAGLLCADEGGADR